MPKQLKFKLLLFTDAVQHPSLYCNNLHSSSLLLRGEQRKTRERINKCTNYYQTFILLTNSTVSVL